MSAGAVLHAAGIVPGVDKSLRCKRATIPLALAGCTFQFIQKAYFL